ncbi:MAG TPA: caspase family protein [Methylomirabilota bacterium]|nr:caspase family protein [Methylomirabilota bacterium]
MSVTARRRLRPVRWSRLPVAALALLSAACGTAGTQPTARPTGPGAVESFMVVDCLLPGQIRQLGGQVTYVTARRAVKTAARDCEIRGGEYVAFDRANYATALKVWLPLAEQGDQAAQTYVGEIFEKGLGVQPDYATAATWYRRAAERGYSRAALNLGTLYERGLGVPRDPAQALSWYRRAAGSKDVAFEIAPAAATAEVVQLRAEVGELRRELDAKGRDLARVQGELDAARRALDGRRGEVEAERRRVEQLRRELDDTKRRETNAGARAARVAELERTITEREAALAAKSREMDGLRASVTRLESDSRDQRERLERLRQQTATSGAGPVIQILQPELRTLRDGAGVRASVASDRPVVVGRVASETELVTLTVNDRAEKLLANNVFRAEIALPQAEQPVRIVAVDRQGRRGSVDFVLARMQQRAATPAAAGPARVGLPRAASTAAFGRYHALVIGNNDYKLLRPLKTAVADAREVARVLEADYGFQVRLLVNATRYDILAALNEQREKLTEKDNLLIYYAGHGELDDRNQRGHWLPIDAEPNSTANWISNVAITDVLNAMTVQQLLVVADSCYAGTLTRSALGRLEGGLSEGERQRLLSVMAHQRSRMVMTSGGVEPVLDSAGGRHSAFAQAFLEVLRANVGLMPGQELFGHLRLRVASVADRVQMRQVPEYAPIKYAGHESGDFVFVRSN